MKKKVMAVLTAAGMAGMLLSPFTAMAADQSVSVSYTKANEYELSIPKTVTLSASEETVMEIGATKMNIEPGKEVRVSVKKGINDGKVTLQRKNSKDLATSKVSMSSNGTLITSVQTVAIFSGRNTNATTGGKLYFSAMPATLAAGEWTGQIVFEVGVK